MTLSGYLKQLTEKLKLIYSENEAYSVGCYFVEELLNISKSKILTEPDMELGIDQLDLLKSREERILKGEPVQYVTGTAWFYGLKFFVNSSVLIPRQETEILVDYLINKYRHSKHLNILDIGTGTGCISITLKKYIPQAEIYAVDISKEALSVCNSNMELNDAEIITSVFDILSANKFPFEKTFNLVVSNPPYVLNSEKKEMHINVVGYEPALALYVDDSDPLIFYRHIAQLMKKYTHKDSELVFEINEKYADEIISINMANGFTGNMIIKDLNNKNRFVSGIKD